MLKKIISLVLAFVIVMGAVIMTSADTISDLEDERDRLDQEAQEQQGVIDDKQEEIDKQQANIDEIVAQIEDLNAQIQESRDLIAEYETRIDEKEDEIKLLEEEIEENITAFGESLRAIYMAGDVTTLEILLGASDFTDVIDKFQLLETMNERDTQLLIDIEDKIEVINAETAVLDEEKALLEEEHEVLEEAQEELDALLKEHEDALALLYTEMEDAEAILDSIESSQSENEQKILDYYEEQRRQEEEKNNQNSQGGSSGPVIGGTVPDGGGYVWPTPGHITITSYYSEDRGSYYHGGLDIAGSNFMGATTVAADSGTVIDSYSACSHNWGKYGSCGCNGGWGNYVWIDHGNGKATIYAHLSYPVVYSGEYVQAGQVIGYAGSTGYSTGAHLHFETRYNGVRYDPLSEYPLFYY